MQFIISKQIAVEAETPEEAVANIATGKSLGLQVTARGVTPQRPAMVAGAQNRVTGPQPKVIGGAVGTGA